MIEPIQIACIDTSCIVAFHYPEEFSEEADLIHEKINSFLITKLTSIELISALNKKVRTKVLQKRDIENILNSYQSLIDNNIYQQIALSGKHLEAAETIISKSEHPIRTLDAIQLGIAFSESKPIASFDNILSESAEEFGVQVIRS